MVDAMRALMLGGPTLTPLLNALAWTVGGLLVFVVWATHVHDHMNL